MRNELWIGAGSALGVGRGTEGQGERAGTAPGPGLVRRVPNLCLDITGILEFWRRAAAEVGPERVLFAIGTPFTDPGILVSNVRYALDLDEEAKRLICGDNLRRLLGGVQ